MSANRVLLKVSTIVLVIVLACWWPIATLWLHFELSSLELAVSSTKNSVLAVNASVLEALAQESGKENVSGEPSAGGGRRGEWCK
jgi:hypothetical protein